MSAAADEIKHFLVTYDPACRRSTVREFDTDYELAQQAYEEAEKQTRGTDLNVVLLSADSLDTVKRTHSSYFELKSFDALLPV